MEKKPSRLGRLHMHRVAAKHPHEVCDLLQMPQRILWQIIRQIAHKVHIEEVAEAAAANCTEKREPSCLLQTCSARSTLVCTSAPQGKQALAVNGGQSLVTGGLLTTCFVMKTPRPQHVTQNMRHVRERDWQVHAARTCTVGELDRIAAHGARLDLSHVQVAQRKHAQRLEQLPRALHDREHHRRLELHPR